MLVKTQRRRPKTREEYTLEQLRVHFPSGEWVVDKPEREAEVVEAPGCDPGGSGFESRTSPPVLQLVRPTEVVLEDGTPLDVDDIPPKLKFSVQRTGQPATLFPTKTAATRFASALIKLAKEGGAKVVGSASTGRWAVYPKQGDPWGMVIFARPRVSR